MLPAADVLVKLAERQRQAGDYVDAAATLERALRIQPLETSEQAYLWNRLASIRMEQGLYSQAGNLASRSNALAKDQASLKQSNWGIISVARRAAGDTAGAAEAERMARGG
jgi:tRNA(Glu) U13 pseudouridine synthase TruD